MGLDSNFVILILCFCFNKIEFICVCECLAIGSGDKKLRLYDVRNWECFLAKQFNFPVDSLHLTPDLKYLTAAGEGGDMCHVLQIQ